MATKQKTRQDRPAAVKREVRRFLQAVEAALQAAREAQDAQARLKRVLEREARPS